MSLVSIADELTADVSVGSQSLNTPTWPMECTIPIKHIVVTDLVVDNNLIVKGFIAKRVISILVNFRH